MQRAQSTAVRLPSSTRIGLTSPLKDEGAKGLVSGVDWLTITYLFVEISKTLHKLREYDKAVKFLLQQDSRKKISY